MWRQLRASFEDANLPWKYSRLSAPFFKRVINTFIDGLCVEWESSSGGDSIGLIRRGKFQKFHGAHPVMRRFWVRTDREFLQPTQPPNRADNSARLKRKMKREPAANTGSRIRFDFARIAKPLEEGIGRATDWWSLKSMLSTGWWRVMPMVWPARSLRFCRWLPMCSISLAPFLRATPDLNEVSFFMLAEILHYCTLIPCKRPFQFQGAG